MARKLEPLFGLCQDLRHGLRVMRKAPGLTAVALASLSIGIGASTAIFSIVHCVLIRPLPYPDPGRLFMVGLAAWHGGSTRPVSVVSPELFQKWRYSVGAFAGSAAVHETYEVNLTGGGPPERLDTQLVTGEFFRVLGVQPVIGRYLTPDDDLPGGQMVAVLSYPLWVQRFARRKDVVGQKIELDDRSYFVVGVMPRGFHFLNPNAALWRPFGWGPGGDRSPTYYIRSFARLKPDATIGQARGELAALFESIFKGDSRTRESSTLTAEPLDQQLTGSLRQSMIVLLCGVGFVLLIACANVANLLLSRAAAHENEMRIRAALGASRFRLLRQHLTESVVLGLFGCALGALFAAGAVPALVRFIPEDFPRRGEIGIDATVLAISILASIATGLVVGMLPAWSGSRGHVEGAGRSSGARLQGTRFHRRVRQLLATVQIAAALVLLTGCGLMIRTFWALEHTTLGFEWKDLYTFQTRLARDRYTKRAGNKAAIDPRVAPAFERVLENLRALPGVRSAAAVTWLPMNGFWSEWRDFAIEGRIPRPKEEPPGGGYNPVSTDFFRTFGIRLSRGRDFTPYDTEAAPWVAIVNETAARVFWQNQNPIGTRIRMELDDRPREVVGIVADVKHEAVQEQEGNSPQVYVPTLQQSLVYPFNRTRGRMHMSFAVRSGSRENWEPEFRRVVARVDPDMPVYAVQPMRHYVAATERGERLYLMLLSIFAGVAVTLAAIGVYGVINYSVARRTQEIGVRMALGARAGDAVRLVLREGLAVTACGLALGLGLAHWLTRFLKGSLFGVQPTDLRTFVSVSVALALIAILASYVPARRASRIDPVVSLRQE